MKSIFSETEKSLILLFFSINVTLSSEISEDRAVKAGYHRHTTSFFRFERSYLPKFSESTIRALRFQIQPSYLILRTQREFETVIDAL